MRRAAVLLAPVLLVLLAACDPGPAAPTGTPVPSASGSSPIATSEPVAEFTAPSSCSELLGPLEAQFAADGLVLFSSTDGTGIYAPIASTQEGGDPFSCWYGKDGVDLSTIEIAAQAVDEQQHEGIVAVLESEGFELTLDEDRATYVQVGDEGATPAIVHVLRPDSWLTGYSALGGPDRVAVLTEYLEQVGAQLYP